MAGKYKYKYYRLNIVLSPETRSLLSLLCEARGKKIATVIRQVIIEAAERMQSQETRDLSELIEKALQGQADSHESR